MGLSPEDRALIKAALVSVGHSQQGAADIAADPSEYAMDDEDLRAIFSAIRAEATTAQAEALATMTAERDLLQDILDSRPAINAALPDNYVRWSQAIYSGDFVRAVLSQGTKSWGGE